MNKWIGTAVVLFFMLTSCTSAVNYTYRKNIQNPGTSGHVTEYKGSTAAVEFKARYELIATIRIEGSYGSAVKSRGVEEAGKIGGDVIYFYAAGSRAKGGTTLRHDTHDEINVDGSRTRVHTLQKVHDTSTVKYVYADIYRQKPGVTDKDVERVVRIDRDFKQGRLESALKDVTIEEIVSDKINVPASQYKQSYVILKKRPDLDKFQKFDLALRFGEPENSWALYNKFTLKEKAAVQNRYPEIMAWSNDWIVQFAKDVDRLNQNTKVHDYFISRAKASIARFKNSLSFKQENLKALMLSSKKVIKCENIVAKYTVVTADRKPDRALMEEMKFKLEHIIREDNYDHAVKMYTIISATQKKYQVLDSESWEDSKAYLLYIAAGYSDRITQYLLKEGCSPTRRVHLLQNPARYLTERHIKGLSIKEREKFALNKNNKDHWSTALHYAADRNRIESARILLDYGVDPHMEDSSGLMPSGYVLYEYEKNRPMLRLLKKAERK